MNPFKNPSHLALLFLTAPLRLWLTPKLSLRSCVSFQIQFKGNQTLLRQAVTIHSLYMAGSLPFDHAKIVKVVEGYAARMLCERAARAWR